MFRIRLAESQEEEHKQLQVVLGFMPTQKDSRSGTIRTRHFCHDLKVIQALTEMAASINSDVGLIRNFKLIIKFFKA